MKRIIIVLRLTITLMLVLESCNDLYKAGSQKQMLDLQIKTNLSQDLLFRYLDSAEKSDDFVFKLPSKYSFLRNGGDLEYFPRNNKVVYFKNYPAEAYHLSSNGVFFVAQFFNPAIDPSRWVTVSNGLGEKDYKRIEKRIDTVLQILVKALKMQNLPDSLLFVKKPLDSIMCEVVRP